MTFFTYSHLNPNTDFFLFPLSHSGLMYKKNFSIRRIPEIVAHSGSALLHFFSDDAYNMSGFNISYRVNGCPTSNSGELKQKENSNALEKSLIVFFSVH
jgi:hypothetical protein